MSWRFRRDSNCSGEGRVIRFDILDITKQALRPSSIRRPPRPSQDWEVANEPITLQILATTVVCEAANTIKLRHAGR